MYDDDDEFMAPTRKSATFDEQLQSMQGLRL